MQQTMVFVTEKRREPLCFIKKIVAELARRRRVATLVFRREKRIPPLIFLSQSIADHALSVQNPFVQRPFQSKTEGSDAMGLSGLSQRRDLAKDDGVEPLSLLDLLLVNLLRSSP